MAITKVPYRDPQTGCENAVDAEVVEILEISDRPTVVTLSDGAKLRLRVDIAEVSRIISQRDSAGNPIYNVKSGLLVSLLDIPKSLQRTPK